MISFEHLLRRRLDDYYSYTDEKFRQHPHYTISMLVVLGLLVTFIIGYALYECKNCVTGECDAKEIQPFEASNNNQETTNTSRQQQAASSSTMELAEMSANDGRTVYVNMMDIQNGVAA